jgi:reverse gyrase
VSRLEDKYCRYCGEVLDFGQASDMCKICSLKGKEYDKSYAVEEEQKALLEEKLAKTEEELSAAYAELSKQRPAITAIFDREVWKKVKEWAKRLVQNS